MTAFATALAHFQRGEHAAAEAVLAPLVARDPGNVDALHLLASAQHARGDFARAIVSFAAASKLAPNDAALAFNHAAALAAADRHAEAVDAFARALVLQPNDAEAHFARGSSLSALKRHDEALACYDAALAAGLDHLGLRLNRAAALIEVGRYEAALTALDAIIAQSQQDTTALALRSAARASLGRFDVAHADVAQALALAPERPDLLMRLWYVYAAANRREEARGICERVLELDPANTLARYGMADALLASGDFGAGWEFYESRALTEERVCVASSAPRWNGEDLRDKTLLVQGEQGFGDLFQFCRFIPNLAQQGARIILQERPQTRLLMQTLAGVTAFALNTAPPPEADFVIPLCSLMRALKVRVDGIPAPIPYLSADPRRVTAWRTTLGPTQRRRIGIAWAGNQRKTLERPRSLTTEALQALLRADADLVSLLPDAAEHENILAKHGVRDYGAATADFADLAALIETLDLVITIDTGVAHLAGALGKPVWIMLPHRADWRWLQARTDTPWYPQARLFRQAAFGDWASVTDSVLAALQ